MAKMSKQALKEPDEFLTFSHKLMQFILENKIAISGVLGIIFAAIIVVSGISYYSDKAEDKVFALMDKEITIYDEAVKTDGNEKAYDKVDKNFQSLLNEYSSRDGAKAARIVYANIAYNAGQFDKAVDLYEKALQDFNNTPSLRNIILNNLAYSYEGKKDYENALKYFNMIVSGMDSLMKDQATFNLGRIYAETGNTEKSREAYKKLISDYPDSLYIDMVKERQPAES